jgi:hypothetical protein
MGRLSKPAIAALVTALLIAGGGAYALASSTGSTISVCVNHTNRTLYKAKKCAKHDRKLSWNKQGRTGPRGPQGTQGIQGVQGQTGPSNGYFARTLSSPVSLPVPAGNYVVYGQGFVANATASPVQASCFLSANGTALSAQDGSNGVTIPAFPGNGEVSDEGIAHLSAAGNLENTCNGGGGTVFSDAITAIKVDTASP